MDKSLDPYIICFESPESPFVDLLQEQKEILSKSLVLESFKKGDLIYREGQRPNGILCLIMGQAKIFKEGVSGREQIVRLAKPLEIIGYRAFFAEECYRASAMALEDSMVGQFNRYEILPLLLSNQELMIRILKSMANELGTSESRTVSLTQKHIRGRLAESLLFLINTYGYEEDGVTINAGLSREDLANLSNMTTSNAIRTLSHFTTEGVLSIDGRKIHVLDFAELGRISRLG